MLRITVFLAALLVDVPSFNGVFQKHGAKVRQDTEGGAASHNLSRLEL